jgi:hypothetical protein
MLWLFALGLQLSGCIQLDPVDLALNHMLERQSADGYFRYEFDFVRGRWSDKNNLVRQAGSAYALAEYLQHHDDQRVRAALARALQAFAADSVPWGDGMLLTEQSSPQKAKAGATALALIAGLWYRQVSGDRSFDNSLHAWRSGLLSLRNPDGLFFSRPGSTKESPYSNGEAWLALAIHGVVFPQDLDVRDTLALVDEAVLEQYGKNADIGFFHWGLMAAAARYQATGDPRLVEFTLAQLRAYLGELRPHLNPNSNSCYSVEGMAAAMQVLRESDQEEQIRQLLQIRIQAEMEKNVALQIPLGAREIPLGEKRELHSPDLKRFAGAFLNGRARPRIRIDATQHCLSAMLKQRALNRY